MRWTAGAFLIAGVGLVIAGIGWTRSVDELLTFSTVAALAFGLPAATAALLAMWLDHIADRLERHLTPPSVSLARPGEANANPFREPLRRYLLAVALVAVAWALRSALDGVVLAQVPFISFYLAVGIAGWLGGIGPAVVATVLSATIAWRFYVQPAVLPGPEDLGSYVLVGLFVFVCVCIGAVSAALHAALARVQQLADELRECRTQLALVDQAADMAPASSAGPDGTEPLQLQ
ncbi:MAG: DUF4118 domain-containing protein [Burkholderiales bacterium]|nr:DUF4118 domain-containing protein [Burkholderiales bacterium]